VSKATPIVDDQEMLRAYAETIRLKDAEIERLKALVKDRMYELQEINELKSLLTRAVDALQATRKFDFISREVLDANGITEDLIAELRRAAE